MVQKVSMKNPQYFEYYHFDGWYEAWTNFDLNKDFSETLSPMLFIGRKYPLEKYRKNMPRLTQRLTLSHVYIYNLYNRKLVCLWRKYLT